MKVFTCVLASFLAIGFSSCCGSTGENAFFCAEEGHFSPAEGFSGTDPYYYIGTNLWYGAILGSETQYGDRQRLLSELDSLHSLGLDNLRVLVGGDGPEGIPSQIEPSLQKEAGVYDEDVFRGLDFLLAEMGKRKMSAVLYLNNAWEWSGGYGRYLEWAGAGDAVLPSVDGWPAYMEFASGFVTNGKAKELFAAHVRTVVSRVNSITGKAYRDDPAIFSWQIANEPRCFSSSDSAKAAFADWIWETASLIKSIDPHHMVSVGSEGRWGCENDMSLYEKIHSCPDIDYLTAHIWPYNWGWVSSDSLEKDIDNAVSETDKYIDEHLAVARKLGKPLVIEEFGFPRDGFVFEKGTPVQLRDRYYRSVFGKVLESKKECGLLAGVNFWGWGGLASQSGDLYWKPGDDYCADPAQEQQGLNSVYASDSTTVALIKESISELDAAEGLRAEVLLENDWMYTAEDGARLHVEVESTGDLTGSSLEMVLKKDTGEELDKQTRPLSGKGQRTEEFRFVLDPGFYRVTVALHTSDTSFVVRQFNIGCDPEKIVSPQDKQPDFDEFWSESLVELAKVEPEYRLTLVPERSNDVRRTYHVEMYSYGGEKISGVYIEPVKEGRYPVFINYMGYGAQMWYNDPSARPGAAEFTLCVRNQGLNRKPGEKDDWVVRGLADKDTYYYHGAFMDVVRAIDFVASREKVDTSRIFAEGGSQGGAFTLVSASLDDRIKGIAPFVPFLSDFPDYFRIVGWPAQPVLAEAERLGISDEDLYRTLSYFDVKNFTDRITCPVLMGFGLQDETCPPHTNFSGYNMISSPKSYITFPLAGHHVETEAGWWTARDAFFADLMSE